MARKKAPIVKLQENVPKIIFSIAYVIKFANSHGKTPSQYDIAKTIFLADRAHLNKWGRPITYDNYFAVKFGPIPSLTLDILKENEQSLKKFQIGQLPWKRKEIDTHFEFFDVSDLDYENILSPSDMEVLKESFGTVSVLTFPQIKKLTHDDPAYIDAWEADSTTKRFQMSLALLFDTPNFEEAERVFEQSMYV